MLGVHCVVAEELPGKLEFETNRLRFIGRGRTPASSGGDGSRRKVER